MFSVVIPTLNEQAHIGDLVNGLLSDGTPDLLEVIVADGGSSDGTQDIVARLAAGDARVRLLHNAARIQAAAVNLAAELADPRATVLVRLDAHAAYPPGFVSAAVRSLQASGADSVVVRLLTRGEDCFQKAVAAVSNSKLGTGGSTHRVGGASRWIDHGHHAAFRRDSFRRLGGYDQSFPANEDAEYDARLGRAGGRIWFDADLQVIYFPRRTPSSLARQYFRNGVGRARNFLKHREGLKLRQLAPPVVLVAICAAILTAPYVGLWTLLFPCAYAAACLAAALMFAVRRKDACLLGAALALPIIHLAWGAGFLASLARQSDRGRLGHDAPPGARSRKQAEASR